MSHVDQAVPPTQQEVAGWGWTARARHAGASGRRLAQASVWLEERALYLAGLAAIAAFNLAEIPQHFGQDGWLALVDGRYIAAHGIPSSDTLTALTLGARWVDQQWLAQLVLYRVERLGGLLLYTGLYVALTTAAFGAMIAVARSLGGTERNILWVLPAAGFLYVVGSYAIRTQGLAYPLFVAVVWLLAKDARNPGRRRVYLVFPLLVVWANLHGSVTLGVGLAVLYGSVMLVEDLRHGGLRAIRRRTAIFLLLSPLCLLATPYGVSIFGYYRETLLNPTFGKAITEWRPATSVMALAIPCLALAAATIWLLGRSGRRTRAFDQLALLALAAGAVFAIRNITWFGLAAGMLLPACIGEATAHSSAAPRRRNVNIAIAWLSIAVLTGSLIAVASRPAAWFERGYNSQTLASVERIAKQWPTARVFADARYSDWLLWHDPALAGKLAYDARFELLSQRQLLAIAYLGVMLAPHDLDVLKGFPVLVLDRSVDSTKLLLSRPGTRLLSKNSDAVIALNHGD